MQFGINLTMGKDQMESFCEHVWRYEGFIRPEAYVKAVLVTLSYMGYDENWLYDVLKPHLLAEMNIQRRKNGFRQKRLDRF